MTGVHPNLFVPKPRKLKQRTATGELVAPVEVSANGEPTKIIMVPEELQQFLTSPAFAAILAWVESLNEAVKMKKKSDPFPVSEAVSSILSVLEEIDVYIQEIPPLVQKSRFGNKAFITFCDKIEQSVSSLTAKMVPAEGTGGKSLAEVVKSTGPYLVHSFGDKQRLDYGSGHELNFVMWLFSLDKLGVVNSQDYTALVLKVFDRYLELMRHLQVQYWLEPAGSHGVWGLDDYQFLPFLFGSAQLIDHKYIGPKSICNVELVEGFAKDYMYLRCIQFINQVKNGSFFEHSPLLYDISGAKTWAKVNEGMIKMFRAEVMGKLPIMRHFFFGEMIPLTLMRQPEEEEDPCGEGHTHHHSDEIHSGPQVKDDEGEGSKAKFRVASCCTQHIPSAIAAKAIESEGQNRPLNPF